MDSLKNLHITRWEELPDFPLYMDQVVELINRNLSCLYDEEDKLITKTMVNNYVKHGIVKPPIKKKYDKEQLAYLIVICLLKNVYSFEEISALIHVQISAYELSKSYNYFVNEFEDCLKAVLNHDEVKQRDAYYENEEVVYLLHSTVLSLAYKIKIQKSIKK